MEEWKYPRQRKRRYQRKNSAESNNDTTFYVSNLPRQCTLGCLWREFRNCGKMVDAYLARRRDKMGKFFAFIRFEDVRSTEGMVKELNRVQIGDAKVKVNVAKFGKETITEPIRGGRNEGPINAGKGKQTRQQVWKPKGVPTYRDILAGKNQQQCGEVSQKVVLLPSRNPPVQPSWRNCSLVGYAADANRLCRMNDLLETIAINDVCIRYVGGMRVLLTFSGWAEKNQFLQGEQHVWSDWFSGVEEFVGQTWQFERIAWVKIVGIPPHLWDKETFNMIGRKLGTLVHESYASTTKDGNLAYECIGVLVNDGNQIKFVLII
ncbi:putative RNA recognition motif domain, nucleotide-binding alpha-beta plait domain superfamily [Helianthus debilis subsp. tardiflorus]